MKRFTERQSMLCRREWIVSACTFCNEERSDKIESPEALLFVYSRFLMPFRGINAIARIEDVQEFAAVLAILQEPLNAAL